MENKTKENQVHLYGTICGVSELKAGDATKFILRVSTQESWLKQEGLDPNDSESYNRKKTYTDVSYITGLQKEKDMYRLIGRNCEENKENWDPEKKAYKEGYIAFQPVNASIDGKLISYQSQQKKDGKPLFITIDGEEKPKELFCRQCMVAADEIRIVEKRRIIGQNENGEDIKEPSNRVEIKGNVTHIEKVTGETQDGKEVSSYIVTVATKYYTNETVKDENGNESRKMTEKSSSFDVRVTKKNIGEDKKDYDVYKKIESGEIGLGDLVDFTGQLHNNSYEIKANDANGKEVDWKLNKMVIDCAFAKVLHKSEKKAEAQTEEQGEGQAQTEEKPKKAQPKKGMHM